ncbi:RlpA-like double-psi beta-barrel-protein domain-containing protein-containing protein [Irpex rosettiformis]|uniref:RlpA-like double-psi beta-barrel-protein domain-containing protein-containing protein n=1 Tax=Irpex rosettiformis TaxID=378272 RepID=A0ACB8TWI7_9APHY|nr:RlpA-like double-psi beta-barrel-protein domain-containing protein-containing protein [Irpex rosettiformis]
MFTFTKLAILSVAFVGSVNGATHSTRHRRHTGTNYLQRDDNATHVFEKRFDNARMTFYETGMGACGKTNSDGDFIVALNSQQFAGGSHCFETITISYQGKTTQATIMDECPGCPYAGLDLSPGLFSFFASQDAGVINAAWDFGSGAAQSKPSPTTKASPTTEVKTTKTPDPTPTPTPTPSPTTVEEKTSSFSSKQSSSFSSSSSSESSSSASSSSVAEISSSSATSSSAGASASASASASPSASVTTGNIDAISNGFVQLLLVAVAGAGSK